MIYLDNASTTKPDPRVVQAMLPYLEGNYGNPGTVYSFGREAEKAVSKAREQVAEYIGAKPDQIIFTSGGGEANNMVIKGTLKSMEIAGRFMTMYSSIEHDSIMNAVNDLKYENNWFGFTEITPSDHGDNGVSIGRDDVEKAVYRIKLVYGDRATGLVSVMHTNNETGIRNDIEEIGKYCHEHDIMFHTDCVQAAGCEPLNVDKIGCYFMSLSSHKIHGPKGIGALYVRNKTSISPLIFGGENQEFGLRGGTENVPGIVGFGKACEILTNDPANNSKYISDLRKRLYDGIVGRLSTYGLQNIVHINGNLNLDNLGKTMNLRFDGIDGQTLMLLLDSNGVCVSTGSACNSHETKPSRVLKSIGLTDEEAMSSIRISVSRMNTVDEIDTAAGIIADSVYSLHSVANG
jgi:cysteine desulfurase